MPGSGLVSKVRFEMAGFLSRRTLLFSIAGGVISRERLDASLSGRGVVARGSGSVTDSELSVACFSGLKYGIKDSREDIKALNSNSIGVSSLLLFVGN